MITEQHKQELMQFAHLEPEDLDILKGGTMHLASLEQMAVIVDYLRSKGYDLKYKWRLFKESEAGE
jgi:hypothetical protein